MVKRIIIVISFIIVTFILGIICLLIGMNIGGNFFTDFEFMGSRGYEATGTIGFFIGIIIGTLLSSTIFIVLLRKQKI